MNEPFARINLTIPRETHERLNKYIPKGLRNNVYLSLIAKFAELLESEGSAALVAVLDGDFRIDTEQ